MNFKSIFILFLYSFFALIVKSLVSHTFYPSSLSPDFLLILVTALALSFPDVRGLIFSLILGMLDDLASAYYLGPSAIGSIFAFYFTVFVSTKMYAERVFAKMLIVFIAFIVKFISKFLVLYLYVENFEPSGLILKNSLYEALLTCFFAPVVFKLLSWKQDMQTSSMRKI